MTQHPLKLHLTLADLKRHEIVTTPKIVHHSQAQLGDIVHKLTKKRPPGALKPIMNLSARQPYDPTNGNIDVYMPGRWDTTYNLIFMDPIVLGAMPGEWTGSAAYVNFKAPATATYLVVAYFTGYQITLVSHGPWGDSSAYTAATTDTGSLATIWNGTAGEGLFFTANFTGGIIGYIESIQVFQM